MNEQNLKSFSERTEKEQREIQQKGGIASGEARRRKRDIRLALEALLEKDYRDKHGNMVSGAEATVSRTTSKALVSPFRAFSSCFNAIASAPLTMLPCLSR